MRGWDIKLLNSLDTMTNDTLRCEVVVETISRSISALIDTGTLQGNSISECMTNRLKEPDLVVERDDISVVGPFGSNKIFSC